MMIIDPEFVVAQSKTEHEVIEIAKNADGILNQYAPITERESNHLIDARLSVVMARGLIVLMWR